MKNLFLKIWLFFQNKFWKTYKIYIIISLLLLLIECIIAISTTQAERSKLWYSIGLWWSESFMVIYSSILIIMMSFYARSFLRLLYYFIVVITLFYWIYLTNIFYDIFYSCYDWCGIQVVFFYPILHWVILIISMIFYWAYSKMDKNSKS